jgi:cyanate lyase
MIQRRSDRGDPGFKKEKELTFEAIAQKVGAHKVWTAAALLGQHPMSPEQADTWWNF